MCKSIFELEYCCKIMVSIFHLGMIMHAKLFLSNDAKQLSALVGYEDGSVILWDVASCLVKSHIKTHKDAGKGTYFKYFSETKIFQ